MSPCRPDLVIFDFDGTLVELAATPDAVVQTLQKAFADALAELRAGRPVLVADDADREKEGEIIFAAVAAAAITMPLPPPRASSASPVAA